MNLGWAEVLNSLVGGLGAALGVYATQEGLAALRRRGWYPARWTESRTFLLPWRGRDD